LIGAGTMDEIKRVASVYYLGIVIGYFSKEDVIKWADSVIEYFEGIVSDKLIELSLSVQRNKEDVASKLINIIDGEFFNNAQNVFYGIFLSDIKNKKVTFDTVITMLYLILNQQYIILSDEEYQKIMYLSDGYYLATEGIYGDIQKIENETIDFLEEYAIYCSLNL